MIFMREMEQKLPTDFEFQLSSTLSDLKSGFHGRLLCAKLFAFTLLFSCEHTNVPIFLRYGKVLPFPVKKCVSLQQSIVQSTMTVWPLSVQLQARGLRELITGWPVSAKIISLWGWRGLNYIPLPLFSLGIAISPKFSAFLLTRPSTDVGTQNCDVGSQDVA